MVKRFLKSFLSFNSTSITVALVILVLVVFLWGVPILNLIELKTYDLRFRAGGAMKPSDKVVMAVIDEKSLDSVGVWPWPRARIAELVDRLSEDGAKVIGFDLFFTEPDKNSSPASHTEIRAISHRIVGSWGTSGQRSFIICECGSASTVERWSLETWEARPG